MCCCSLGLMPQAESAAVLGASSPSPPTAARRRAGYRSPDVHARVLRRSSAPAAGQQQIARLLSVRGSTGGGPVSSATSAERGARRGRLAEPSGGPVRCRSDR